MNFTLTPFPPAFSQQGKIFPCCELQVYVDEDDVPLSEDDMADIAAVAESSVSTSF
jgi:hypothetical protein